MTQPKLVPLHTLKPGSSFFIPFTGRYGVLNLANECRANVTFRAEKVTRTFKAKKRNKQTGIEEEKDVTVPDRSGTTDITPNVLVQLVSEPAPREESVEDLL